MQKNSDSPTERSGSAQLRHRFLGWRGILVLVCLVLIGAAIVVPRMVDARAVINLAARAVEENTGRTLTVKGPVTVRVWPRLAVVADDVALGNAPWAVDSAMATAQRVALSLDWMPLLRQSISINQAELDGLVLNLQAADKGHSEAGNWVLTSPSSEPTSPQEDASFNIESIQLNDATVRMRDARGAVSDTLLIDKTRASFERDAVSFKGQVVWRQQAMDLKGRFAYPAEEPNSLTLSANTRFLDLSRGSLNGLGEPGDTPRHKAQDSAWWQDERPLDFSVLPAFNVQLDLVAAQVRLPNQAVLPNVNLAFVLSQSGGGSLNVQRFESGFGKGQITASGSLSGFAGSAPAPVLTLKANASGFELARLVSLQNLQVPGVTAQGGQVQLDVDLTANGRSPRQLIASLAGYARATIGAGTLVDKGSQARAPVSVSLKSFNAQADFKSGVSPQLAVDLNASNISFEGEGSKPRETVQPHKSEVTQRWLFGTDSLGLNTLPLMNARVGLSVATLVLSDGIVLPDFLLNASFEDTAGGVMKVATLKSGFGGGVLMADGAISQYTSANPTIRLRGHARDFRLDRLATQMDQKRTLGDVKGGQAELAFHLEGQGASPRALASGLNGEFQLSINQATLPNALVNSSGDFLLSVFNAVNPMRSKSKTSELQCAVAYLPVRNGQIAIDNSVGIETADLNVVLNGQIDLKQEKLNVAIQSAQKSGLTTGVNPSGLVVIEGSLLNPTLGVNKTGVVKQAASVGLAVVTSGVSLAAQNLWSVTTQKNPCQNILRPWSSIDGQLMPQAKN